MTDEDGDDEGDESTTEGIPLEELTEESVPDGESETGPPDVETLQERLEAAEGLDGEEDVDTESGPLADIAREVRDRRESDAETESELFEEVDVGDLDAERLWESLEADEETLAGEASVGGDTEAERVEREGAAVREDYVVPKDTYCQQCRFFSDPPDAVCTHEGTEIVEVTDSEHFRVRGCPVVEEDETAGFDW